MHVSHLLTGATNLGSSDEEVATQHRMYERAKKVAEDTTSKYVKPIKAAATGPPAPEDDASTNDELA